MYVATPDRICRYPFSCRTEASFDHHRNGARRDPYNGQWAKKAHGLPYDRPRSLPFVKKFRKLSREGKMMVTSNAGAEYVEGRQQRPTSVVQNKLTDSPLSVDFSVISDSRRINLGFDMEQFRRWITPAIVQIVRRVMKLMDPPIPVHICRRDVDAAFHIAFAHPDLCRLVCHYLSVGDIGLDTLVYERINFAFLGFPFGWACSPDYFALMADDIMAIRANCHPSQPRWSGSERFSFYQYVDDALWAEAPLESRQTESAAC